VKQGVEVALASSRGIDRLQAAKLASFCNLWRKYRFVAIIG
jgi:hypothetical protein